MTKEKQIEEMATAISNYADKHEWELHEPELEDLAIELYNAGYRKENKNYIGTDEVLRSIDYRPVEEVRKETAKEIFQRVINICRKEEDFQDGTINTQLEPLYFGIANGCAFIRDEVKELAKQYGVEVQDDRTRTD